MEKGKKEKEEKQVDSSAPHLVCVCPGGWAEPIDICVSKRIVFPWPCLSAGGGAMAISVMPPTDRLPDCAMNCIVQQPPWCPLISRRMQILNPSVMKIQVIRLRIEVVKRPQSMMAASRPRTWLFTAAKTSRVKEIYGRNTQKCLGSILFGGGGGSGHQTWSGRKGILRPSLPVLHRRRRLCLLPHR